MIYREKPPRIEAAQFDGETPVPGMCVSILPDCIAGPHAHRVPDERGALVVAPVPAGAYVQRVPLRVTPLADPKYDSWRIWPPEEFERLYEPEAPRGSAS